MFTVTYYWINPFTTLATLLFSVGPHILQVKSQSLGQACGDFHNLASLCFTNWAFFFFFPVMWTHYTNCSETNFPCLLQALPFSSLQPRPLFKVRPKWLLWSPEPKKQFCFSEFLQPWGSQSLICHWSCSASIVSSHASKSSGLMYVFLAGETLCLSIPQSA